MKRFQFQLEALLRLKRQLQRQAEFRMHDARTGLVAAQQQVGQIRGQMDDVAARLGEALQQPDPFGRHVSLRGALEQLHRQRASAERQLAEAKQVCADASAAYARSCVEVQALDQVRADKWQAHLKERRDEAQHQLDEFMMGRCSDKLKASREAHNDG